MGLVEGKSALVFGVANKYSLAWGIAEALAAEGAKVGISYSMDRLERRVRPLAESIGARLVARCDVTREEEIEAVFTQAADALGEIDILVHAIAFAETEDLNDSFDLNLHEVENSLSASASCLGHLFALSSR